MKKLIHLTDDLAILPHHISAVKRATLDSDDGEDSSIIYLVGQSATGEGFLVDLPLEQVVDEVNEALKQEAIDKARIAAEASAEMAEEKSGKGRYRYLVDRK